MIYGPPLSGKSSVAWRLGRSLPGKTAVISFDGLIQGSIAVRADDELPELDMVHTQARLLVANYMKNGYNVVVEGPFYYRTDGGLQRFEQDIDQLISLMRQMTAQALAVRLSASPEVIRARAAEAWREDEVEESLEAEGAYKERYGGNALKVDTSELDVDQVSEIVRRKLLAEVFT